ncbi:stress-activated map kinase interacting protein 1-domain-containing protein [Cladochytrium replicatum]|nr:stress-activated map kinase interacting protein 1-domain-containing protein [Cladochytrium replicatum]
MALITDPEYLVYKMRSNLLSTQDSLIERIISLPPPSDNDYINATLPPAERLARYGPGGLFGDPKRNRIGRHGTPSGSQDLGSRESIAAAEDRKRNAQAAVAAVATAATVAAAGVPPPPLVVEGVGVGLTTAGVNGTMTPGATKDYRESADFERDQRARQIELLKLQLQKHQEILKRTDSETSISQMQTQQQESQQQSQQQQQKPTTNNGSTSSVAKEPPPAPPQVQISSARQSAAPSPTSPYPMGPLPPPRSPTQGNRTPTRQLSQRRPKVFTDNNGKGKGTSTPMSASSAGGGEQPPYSPDLRPERDATNGGQKADGAPTDRHQIYSYYEENMPDAADGSQANSLQESILNRDEEDEDAEERGSVASHSSDESLDVEPIEEQEDQLDMAEENAQAAPPPTGVDVSTEALNEDPPRRPSAVAATTAAATHQTVEPPRPVVQPPPTVPRPPAENLFQKQDISPYGMPPVPQLPPHITANTNNPYLAMAMRHLQHREQMQQQQVAGGKPVKPKSALTMLITDRVSDNNPFAKEFGFFSAKGLPDGIRLKIYLPFSDRPSYPLSISIRNDATVEDVIGFSLFEYINEGRTPRIPKSVCKVALWNMRIVEDDGTIDDDFPALERSRRIQKFAFDQFALCEAQRGQIYAKDEKPAVAALPSPQTAAPNAAPQAAAPAKPVLLKVHLYSTLEVKQTTTVQMPGNTLLSDVFEHICKKRKYDIKDYVLKMADTKTDIPMDRTLDQLKLTEVCVLKRDRGGAGDIFLRPPDEVKEETVVEQPRFISSDEYSNMYKQYTVTHRAFVGRQQRQLTIDADYIYLMAPESRLFSEMLKMSSFHISMVQSCRQTKKQSTHFKLVVLKNGDSRSYELEASTAEEAAEICQRITILAQIKKRDGASVIRTGQGVDAFVSTSGPSKPLK